MAPRHGVRRQWSYADPARPGPHRQRLGRHLDRARPAEEAADSPADRKRLADALVDVLVAIAFGSIRKPGTATAVAYGAIASLVAGPLLVLGVTARDDDNMGVSSSAAHRAMVRDSR